MRAVRALRRPPDQIAVAFTVGITLPATDVPYFLWAPQAFEVSWTELEFFNPAQAPPADVPFAVGTRGRPFAGAAPFAAPSCPPCAYRFQAPGRCPCTELPPSSAPRTTAVSSPTS